MLNFYVRSGNSNSGPLAVQPVLLPTELAPHPQGVHISQRSFFPFFGTYVFVCLFVVLSEGKLS